MNESFNIKGTSEIGYIEDVFFQHYRSKPDNPNIVFMFHGFPSWVNKNHDIAELFLIKGYDVFSFHYEGLGHSQGVFSFENSIFKSRKIVQYIKQKYNYTRVSCAGHSWGGFVAVHNYFEFNHRILLLAPLYKLPDEKETRKIIDGLFAEAPRDCQNYSTQTMFDEFCKLSRQVDYEGFHKKLQTLNCLLLHGLNDKVIKPELSNAFKDVSGENGQLKLLDDDHGFTFNRRLFLDTIATWLTDSSDKLINEPIKPVFR